MISVSLLKVWVVGWFLVCFGSFFWGMRFFFQKPEAPSLPMRMVQVLAGGFALAHLVWIIEMPTLRVGPACGAVCWYGVAVALFWSAVRAHREKRPAACYGSDTIPDLVVSGPYRMIRHPFYTAYIAGWLAGCLATESLVLLPTVGVMAGFYVYSAFREEKRFAAGRLAEEWVRYRRETGMFLPKLRFFKLPGA